MTEMESQVWSMNGSELVAAARALARKASGLEADLLVHLAEIDDRQLYREWAFPSMFAFCVTELGFSEDAAFNRIHVARGARKFPAILEAIGEGRVHLSGMRLLVPHLTEANHRDLIERAAGKTKREIEELIAEIAPRPPVATMIRSIPNRMEAALPAAPAAWSTEDPRRSDQRSSAANDGEDPTRSFDVAPPSEMPPPRAPAPVRHERPVVPLSAQTYKIQFTASRAFRDRLVEAQNLMRHRISDRNDLEGIFGAALESLIEQVKKERFAVGTKARTTSGSDSAASLASASASAPVPVPTPTPPPVPTSPAAVVPESPAIDANEPGRAASRHIPASIRRAVYERDGGRCTFVDKRGRRCEEMGMLEFEHDDGFALTGRHDFKSIRVVCRAHNQHAAEKLYGRSLMQHARERGRRSGTAAQAAGSGQRNGDTQANERPGNDAKNAERNIDQIVGAPEVANAASRANGERGAKKLNGEKQTSAVNGAKARTPPRRMPVKHKST